MVYRKCSARSSSNFEVHSYPTFCRCCVCWPSSDRRFYRWSSSNFLWAAVASACSLLNLPVSYFSIFARSWWLRFRSSSAPLSFPWKSAVVSLSLLLKCSYWLFSSIFKSSLARSLLSISDFCSIVSLKRSSLSLAWLDNFPSKLETRSLYSSRRSRISWTSLLLICPCDWTSAFSRVVSLICSSFFWRSCAVAASSFFKASRSPAAYPYQFFIWSSSLVLSSLMLLIAEFHCASFSLQLLSWAVNSSLWWSLKHSISFSSCMFLSARFASIKVTLFLSKASLSFSTDVSLSLNCAISIFNGLSSIVGWGRFK